MTRIARPLLAALLAAVLGAPPATGGPLQQRSILVVRHAEKQADGSPDPGLSPEGRDRARRLAALVGDGPVDAVFATPYARTRQTAAPTAQAHGLPVREYDPARPATELAAMLRSLPGEGRVLVVGHSNTVPALAAALCDCDVPAMRDDEYGRWYRLRPSAEGPAALETGTW